VSLRRAIVEGAEVRWARDSARQHANTIAAGLPIVLAGLTALLMVGLFVVLDYRFDQDPHRLVKILAGAVLIASILARPEAGLVALAVLTPYLPWAPRIPVPIVNPLNVLLASVFLSFALTRMLQQEPVFRAGRLSLPLLFLFVLAGLSILRGAAFPTGLGYEPGLAGITLFRNLMTVAVYFIGLAMVRDERLRHRLAWVLVVALVLESVTTIMYGRNGRGGRAIGSFGQSNELGTFLSMFVVYAAALLPAARRHASRVLLLGAIVAGSYATLLSLSRGAILGLAVGLALVALRTSRAAAIVLLVVLGTSPQWAPDYVVDRVMSTQLEDETSDEARLEASAQVRVDTWRAIIDVVQRYPLVGVGFTGLGWVLPEVGNELGVEVKDSAHNTFLRLLGEMGILGLLVFVWLLWRTFFLGRSAELQARQPLERRMGVGLQAMTLVLALNCAFGDRFWPITIMGNFWLLCALVDGSIPRPGERPA
jgi:O-antigen ligase